jgi:hypothetical protein
MTYLGLLVGLPIASAALPAWLLYEVTVANLTSITDDRSTGLKRWYAICTLIFAIAISIPILTAVSLDRMGAFLVGLSLYFVFLMMGVYLFAGDSIGPSRRVVLHWDRSGAGKLRRFFGPSIVNTSVLQLFVGLIGLLLPTITALIAVPPMPTAGMREEVIVLFAIYVVGFFVFSVGFTAFLRSRTGTTLAARMLLLAVHFLVAIGPWVVAAIAGVISAGTDRSALVVAAPSPFYVFLALDALERGSESVLVIGSVFMSVAWGLFGILFLGFARIRTARVITQHNAALAESDRLLAEEDAAMMAQANAPAPQAPSEEAMPAETPPAAEPDAIPAS